MSNSSNSVEASLSRLNHLIGIGVTSVHTLATHIRAHNVGTKETTGFLGAIDQPMVRALASGQERSIGSNLGNDLTSGSDDGGLFGISENQSLSQLSAALSRASKRFL